jgi:hypothetical protein
MEVPRARVGPCLTFFVEVPAAVLVELIERPEVLPFLAGQGCAISLGLLDLSPERAGVVRRLEAAGIPVTAWLLLDVQDGYWLNADNTERAYARWRETLAWGEREGLRLHRVGLDIEPPRSAAVTLTVTPVRTLWPLLRRRRSPEQVRSAERAYGSLVEEIRASGRTVETYHFPQLLDERAAGTTLLRRTLGLVEVHADVEVHMLYPSYLGRAGARSYFPEAPAIALGVTGGGVHAEESERLGRFLPVAALAEDLRAAARYAQDVYIFSLEGCVARGQLDAISDIRWDEPAPALPLRDRLRARGVRVALQSLLRAEPLLDLFLPSRDRG